VLGAGIHGVDILAVGSEPATGDHRLGAVPSDDDMLVSLTDELPMGAEEAWLEDAFAESQSVLQRQWRLVEQIASALIERNSLDRDDLWELFEAYGSAPA